MIKVDVLSPKESTPKHKALKINKNKKWGRFWSHVFGARPKTATIQISNVIVIVFCVRHPTLCGYGFSVFKFATLCHIATTWYRMFSVLLLSFCLSAYYLCLFQLILQTYLCNYVIINVLFLFHILPCIMFCFCVSCLFTYIILYYIYDIMIIWLCDCVIIWYYMIIYYDDMIYVYHLVKWSIGQD